MVEYRDNFVKILDYVILIVEEIKKIKKKY